MSCGACFSILPFHNAYYITDNLEEEVKHVHKVISHSDPGAQQGFF